MHAAHTTRLSVRLTGPASLTLPLLSPLPFPRLSPRFLVHLSGTLALAVVAALVWRALGLPLPWMIGPLLATAGASIAGLPTTTATPLRNSGQWIIGTALGLYFTPEVTRLVMGLWWAVLLAIVWALLLGWGFSAMLHRVGLQGLQGPPQALRATSYFAGAIGGASEMTLLSERAGGRSDLVAGAHSLRMLIITVGLPMAFAWADLHGTDPSLPGVREVHALPLVGLMAATLGGCVLLRLLRWTNPWFTGALVAAMALSMAGVELSAVPAWASNAAQVFIGVSLGVRFRREFLAQAPRWMAAVAVGTLAMIAVSVVFAWGLSWATGLSTATLVLGTAPGGISEMAITAKVLQLGVPMVTAFQVCRLVAVLMLVAPLYRWFEARAERRGLSA